MMGHIIEIEPQIRTRQQVAIIDARKDFRDFIEADMGQEMVTVFDGIVAELEGTDEPVGDDYEAIADGYHNTLVDIMNTLEEILGQPRINRRKLDALYDDVVKEL